jgi:hypothetical protein
MSVDKNSIGKSLTELPAGIGKGLCFCCNDNPTIGLILCAEKDETVVKYSVLSDNKQLFASKYMLYMPKEEELKELIEKDRQLFDLREEEKE